MCIRDSLHEHRTEIGKHKDLHGKQGDRHDRSCLLYTSEKISRRYFTAREQRFVQEAGADGFFRLWARKEAYSKYTGLGLEEIMKGTEVLGRDDVEFFDFQLEKGIYCSC